MQSGLAAAIAVLLAYASGTSMATLDCGAGVQDRAASLDPRERVADGARPSGGTGRTFRLETTR